MRQGVPLIWFWGVGTSIYKPIFPIYQINDDAELQQFVVATDGLQHLQATGSKVEEVMRRYLRAETTRRPHQPVFRSMIMRAYNTRCAVCELKHSVLLDASHIVEDKHESGVAAVPNGLALRKIHHAAYDAGILGVSFRLVVEIRDDMHHEVDGPLLEHRLNGLHRQPLRVIPSRRSEHPDPELLELHYSRFRAS